MSGSEDGWRTGVGSEDGIILIEGPTGTDDTVSVTVTVESSEEVIRAIDGDTCRVGDGR